MTLRELTGQYSVLFEMAEEGNIDPQTHWSVWIMSLSRRRRLMRQSWTRWQERLIRSIKRLHV